MDKYGERGSPFHIKRNLPSCFAISIIPRLIRARVVRLPTIERLNNSATLARRVISCSLKVHGILRLLIPSVGR